MRILLLGDISGTRDGQPWPPRGSTVDVPDDEAVMLVRNNMARPVVDADAGVERAVLADPLIEPRETPAAAPAAAPAAVPAAAPTGAAVTIAPESAESPGPLTTKTGPVKRPKTKDVHAGPTTT